MENNVKELESRREFFKKATHTVLPILGGIVIALIPQVSMATPTGCEGCWGYCTGCQGGCDNQGCKNRCQGGCDSCEGQCRGRCDWTCDGCKGGCGTSCELHCGHGNYF